MKDIRSRDNPLYKVLFGLAHDRRVRRQDRCTLLDGPHLIQAAMAAGAVFKRLVLSQSAVHGDGARWLQRFPELPACVLSDALFKTLSPVESPVGVMAEIRLPDVESTQAECRVLLENIQDPGNLGAIFRVVAAAGVEAVYLSQGCCEAWSPKCLRGGQGAHFELTIFEGVDLHNQVQVFDGPVYAASLSADRSLFDLDLRGPVGFAFGNEGAGLSAQLCEAAQTFIIPMPGKVESLNVATAAAVCLFERVRQRRPVGLAGAALAGGGSAVDD